MKKLNLGIGTRFGRWTIISNETKTMNNVTNWLCECDCGQQHYVPLNNLMNGSSTQCQICSAKKSGKKRRKGHELISGDYWSQIRSNARRKKINFDVRIEEAWEKFVKQEGNCALSGQVIILTGYPYDKELTTAKLSLIEPKLGYIESNIIWIHRDIEKLKGNLSMYAFVRICKQIANHNEE